MGKEMEGGPGMGNKKRKKENYTTIMSTVHIIIKISLHVDLDSRVTMSTKFARCIVGIKIHKNITDQEQPGK